jgi:hypothetical protein
MQDNQQVTSSYIAVDYDAMMDPECRWGFRHIPTIFGMLRKESYFR